MDGTSKIIIGVIIIAAIGLGIMVITKNPDQFSIDESTKQLLSEESPSLPFSENEKVTQKTPMEYSQAIFTTNYGSFTLELDTKNTPKTVENFVKLASSGFYNGIKFHRIIKGFMIQGGDPLTKDDAQMNFWGTGGPGYTFADEIKPTNSNVKGTISMANAGPNTNGSQFFINVADNSQLNPKHTVFGKVTEGYDVVEKISLVPTGQSDRPLDPVIIQSIELK